MTNLCLLVSSLVACGLLVPAVLSRPSVSTRNGGNGDYGYKYEISHPSGSSRVHMTAGNSKNSHPSSYHSNEKPKHKVDAYAPHGQPSSPHTEQHYQPKHIAQVESDPSEVLYEPDPSYPLPYDSSSKPGVGHSAPYDGRPAETYPVSHSNPPPVYGGPAQKPFVQEHVNPTVHQKYEHPSVPVNYPHVDQKQVDVPYSPEPAHVPISHEPSYPPPAQYIEPAVPVSQEYVNPSVHQAPIPVPVSQEYINPPISQKTVHTPIAQEHISPPISQKTVYPPAPVNAEYGSPASPKYVLVPDGPPHVTNSHTTEIVHPPLHQSPGPVVLVPAHAPNTVVLDSEPKPGPITHAFRLPLVPIAPGPAPVPVAPAAEVINPVEVAPITHAFRLPLSPIAAGPSPVAEVINPVAQPHAAPVSHSFRLPIAVSDPVATGSFVPVDVAPVPHAPYDVPIQPPPPSTSDSEIPAPRSIHDVLLHSPVSHSTTLLLPNPIAPRDTISPELSAGFGPPTGPLVVPEIPSTVEHQGLTSLESPSSGAVLPSVSHAFRLTLPSLPSKPILPTVSEGIQPVSVEVKPVADVSAVDVGSPIHFEPVADELSHDTELDLPPFPSIEHDLDSLYLKDIPFGEKLPKVKV